MTVHRCYTFTSEATWPPGGRERVKRKLEQAVDTHWWFRDALEGQADLIQFTLTVSARDQWFAHKRVMKLAADICWMLKIQVPVPIWSPLPPHMNRGRYRMAPASEGQG